MDSSGREDLAAPANAFTVRLRAENRLVMIAGQDDVRMSGRPKGSRARFAAALVAGAALGAVPPAWASRPTTKPTAPNKPPQAQTNPSNGGKSRGAQVTDQGLVQSVAAAAVVLKALDGSSFSVPVGPQTRVLVDGRLAPLSEVKPGFVALVKWEGGKAPQQLAAFDLSAKSGERLATVQGVTKTSVAVSGANGGTVTIHVNVRTRVFVDGKLSTLRSVTAGYTLITSASTSKGGRPAAELRFLSPS
jgi:hypothetical protein